VCVRIDPLKLGPWADGYVLERRHTLSSEFLGHDSFGNPQFDTKYSELGELVFRLKNRNDRNTLDLIAETAVNFTREWNVVFDLIVPVPPSRKRASYQPVVEIATAIGARMPVNVAAVTKIKDTPELKNVFDYNERIRLLQNAFGVDRDAVADKRILFVDDLYRSGATANVVTGSLLAGGATAVYMLAMTKIRTRT
jgi:predicted amidophosphoribosyltransferase